MKVEFDEKGKIFTEVVAKDEVFSELQTTTHIIRGYVHVRKNDRMTDEVNRDERFLAITSATICNPDGSTRYTTDFLVVNRNHIIWLMPIDEKVDASGKDESSS